MAQRKFRIHPAIGVARVGNAPADDFFLARERPNQGGQGAASAVGATVPPYKSGGLIRRQAVRFRVYEYVESGGVFAWQREIRLNDPEVVDLTWTVHLANRKASFFTFRGLVGSPLLAGASQLARRNAGVADRRSLEIDPLPRRIGGKSAKPVQLSRGTSGAPSRELWPVPAPSPAIDSLGELRTDDAGRLIVIGGTGMASARPGASLTNFANNDGWFDDVSDGPVTAKLRLRDKKGRPYTVEVDGAWVLVAPPDFAPGLRPMVSLWDALFDVMARQVAIPVDEAVYKTGGELASLAAIADDLRGGGRSLSRYVPSFDEDVAPILRQAIDVTWALPQASQAHTTVGSGPNLARDWKLLSDRSQPNDRRRDIVNRVRKPGTDGVGLATMPKLLGDDPDNVFGVGRRYLWLTVTQYAILERWASGNFTSTTLGPASLLHPPVPSMLTPHGLDRAALQNASGGAFYPGVDVGWLIADPRLYVYPFRIQHDSPSRFVGDGAAKVRAGYFTRQLALPWQADFRDCTSGGGVWGWWPTQRPDGVYPDPASAHARTSMATWERAGSAPGTPSWPPDPGLPNPRSPERPSFAQMAQNWWKFGFLLETPTGEYVESERAGTIP
jgi:L-Lysine epsilon oxidase N-terminal/L-lysine epsilon oxidase C-terminal domain